MAKEDLLDKLTRHQIFVQRIGAREANKAKGRLNSLMARVRDALDSDLTIIQRARYQSILYDLQNYARETYTAVGADYDEFAGDFLNYESEFSSNAFEQATGVSFDLPNPVQLQSAYRTNIMDLVPNQAGRSIGETIARFGIQAQNQFSQILRDGFALGMTSGQMIRNVSEHISLKRNQVETLIRTSTNHLATQARNETMKENEDVLDGYEWVATLDSRTSLICASRDGIIYPVSDDPEKSPKPPAHYGCRSTIVPAVKPEFDLLADEDERRPFVGPNGKKGVIDGKITYEKWLRKQPKDFQIQVLGRARQELFAKNKLPLSRFIDPEGRTLTLQELRELDVQFNGMKPQEVAQQTIAAPPAPVLSLKGVDGNKIDQAERILNEGLDPLTLKVAQRLQKPKIIDSKPERQGAYYSSGDKYLRTNIKADGKDVHAVTAHEYGHHVDYELGQLFNKPKYTAWSESDPRFMEAFKLDRKALGLVPTQTRKSVSYNLMKDLFKIKQVDGRGRWDFDELPTKGNLCDILDGFTGGICRGDLGGFGHAKSYWAKKGMKEKEAFANMFSIYGTPDWKNVEKIAPNMAKRFVQILEEIAK